MALRSTFYRPTGISSPCKLYIRANGANNSTTFYDDSPGHKTITPNGDIKISTTQSRYGGSSAYFDGTTDYLSLVQSTDFEITTGNFSFTFWLWLNGTWATYRRVAAYGASTPGWNSATGWHWLITVDANRKLQFEYQKSGNANNDCGVSADPIILSTWAYCVISKSGNTVRYWINGTLEKTSTSAPDLVVPSNTKYMYIGNAPGENTQCWYGYIEDFTFYNGIALDGTIRPQRSLI